MKTTIGALLVALAIASPAAAQNAPAPTFSIRLFGLVSSEKFAASDSFNAVFNSDRGIFWGGGVELLHSSGVFADVGYSRFSKTGQRAFLSGGQAYQFNIPLTVTIAPIDILGGYRLKLGRSPVTPYVAAGITSLSYKETSDFSDPSEEIDERKIGPIFAGGVEFSLTRSLAGSVDVSGTHVTGILGSSGVSQQAGEDNVGGLAVRFRIIIGRY